MSKKVDLVASLMTDMKTQPKETSRPELPDEVRPGRSRSRIGKSFVGGYFPPEVAKQVKMLAVEQDTTVQSLTGEALNYLFAAYGKPQIVPPRK